MPDDASAVAVLGVDAWRCRSKRASSSVKPSHLICFNGAEVLCEPCGARCAELGWEIGQAAVTPLSVEPSLQACAMRLDVTRGWMRCRTRALRASRYRFIRLRCPSVTGAAHLAIPADAIRFRCRTLPTISDGSFRIASAALLTKTRGAARPWHLLVAWRV